MFLGTGSYRGTARVEEENREELAGHLQISYLREDGVG